MSTRTIIAVLILLGAFVALSYDKKSVVTPITPAPVACTQEAKQCPDGSFVGRTGPQCQFAECPKVAPVPPTKSELGKISGKVTTFPSCGIQAVPPLPNCGPRPYKTTVSFWSATSKPYKATSDDNGVFTIELPAGTYTVQAEGGEVYPKCPQESVVVKADKTVIKDIVCDSGIL